MKRQSALGPSFFGMLGPAPRGVPSVAWDSFQAVVDPVLNPNWLPISPPRIRRFFFVSRRFTLCPAPFFCRQQRSSTLSPDRCRLLLSDPSVDWATAWTGRPPRRRLPWSVSTCHPDRLQVVLAWSSARSGRFRVFVRLLNGMQLLCRRNWTVEQLTLIFILLGICRVRWIVSLGLVSCSLLLVGQIAWMVRKRGYFYSLFDLRSVWSARFSGVV